MKSFKEKVEDTTKRIILTQGMNKEVVEKMVIKELMVLPYWNGLDKEEEDE